MAVPDRDTQPAIVSRHSALVLRRPRMECSSKVSPTEGPDMFLASERRDSVSSWSQNVSLCYSYFHTAVAKSQGTYACPDDLVLRTRFNVRSSGSCKIWPFAFGPGRTWVCERRRRIHALRIAHAASIQRR